MLCNYPAKPESTQHFRWFHVHSNFRTISYNASVIPIFFNMIDPIIRIISMQIKSFDNMSIGFFSS